MSTNNPITISVKADAHGKFRLYASKLGSVTPAGARLFRGKPWPDVMFIHETEEAALTDAFKLQKYLDGFRPKPKNRGDELNWQ